MSKISQGPNMTYRTAVLACALIAIAVIVPSLNKARLRANRRACYANQKTIAGAFEMYSLVVTKDDPVVLTETMKELHKNGYLQAIPDDPGYGSGSGDHYLQVDGDIMCLKHGGIQVVGDDSESIKKKLRSVGIKDDKLLTRAGISKEDKRKFGEKFVNYGIAFVFIVALWWLLGFIAARKAKGIQEKVDAK